MSTSNGGDACVLGWLRDRHNSETFLLYAHYIPGQAAFPFCCWAGLKSVSLPKMKPHTGLHAGWRVQTCFQQWGAVFVWGALWVWSQRAPSRGVWALSLCYSAVPFRITEGAIACLQLVVAKIDVFTWGQSGSAHGRGVGRSSGHRQVVIHVLYLENTGTCLFRWWLRLLHVINMSGCNRNTLQRF